MAVKKSEAVTMRVKIGDAELEVTGPRDFVEARISEFVKGHEQPPHLPRGSSEAAERTSMPVGKKPTSLAQVFKKVSVKSDIERVLIAGHYLENSEESQSFTAADVREAIRNAKVRPPTNPSDAIAKNIKKGFMMSAGDKEGRMAFVLTTDGDEAVAALLNR
jgi:hypothetical protein